MNVGNIRPNPYQDQGNRKPDPIKPKSPAQETGKIGEERSVKIDQTYLNSDEAEFFVDLFPGAESEVRAHATYRQNGLFQRPQPGSLVDRKG